MTGQVLAVGNAPFQMPVIADITATPPAYVAGGTVDAGTKPTDNVYIVDTGATGAWAGQDGKLAYFDQKWRFIAPHNGYLVMVDNEDTIYMFMDATWTSFANLAAANQSLNAAQIGAAPTVSGLSCVVNRVGDFATLTFTLTAVSITHTDAAGSGSSGSLKIFDFVKGAVVPLASRRNLVWTGDATIDTNAGDMAFVTGLGSVAANAGDGALTATEVDFGAISGALTLSSHVATEATLKGAGTVADGTATASDLYLNESGSAATSDATGALLVTGTITLVVAMVGF